MTPHTINIKPHHFLDIMGYYGTDSLRLTPHPYGHANHLVAQRLLPDRAVLLTIELGADDVCALCIHNLDGECDDIIDISSRPEAPPLKRLYNLLLDQRWCVRLDLRQGDVLPAKEMCRRLLRIAGGIEGIYAEMPPAYAQEKLRTARLGAEKYLAEVP